MIPQICAGVAAALTVTLATNTVSSRVAAPYDVRTFTVSLPHGVTDMMPRTYIGNLAISSDGTAWAVVGNSKSLLRIPAFGRTELINIPDGLPGRIAGAYGRRVYFNLFGIAPTGVYGDVIRKIGAVDFRGRYQSYELPRQFSQVSNLTVTPNGNLWFTDVPGNKIGAMTPGGSFRAIVLRGGIQNPLELQGLANGDVVFSAQTAAHQALLGIISSNGIHVAYRDTRPSNIGLIASQGSMVCFALFASKAPQFGCFDPRAIGTTLHLQSIPDSRYLAISSTGVAWLAPVNYHGLVTIRRGVIRRVPLSGLVEGIAADSTGRLWFSVLNNAIGVASLR